MSPRAYLPTEPDDLTPATYSSLDDLLFGPTETPLAVPALVPDDLPSLGTDEPTPTPAPTTEDDYAALVTEGRSLVATLSRSKWDLGDLLLRVCGPPESHGGDRRSTGHGHLIGLDAYAADIDLTESQASDYRRVADAFPPGQRNLDVSWSVHRELARRPDVPEEERHALIRSERWTRRTLLAHLDGLAADVLPSAEPDPMPATLAAPTTAPTPPAAPAPVPAPPSSVSAPQTPDEPAPVVTPPALALAPPPPVDALAEIDRFRALLPLIGHPLTDEIDGLLRRVRDEIEASAA